MERGKRGDPGGIVGVYQIVVEHSTAVEYDLLVMGYRARWLTDPVAHDFNWADLKAIIELSPRGSALATAIQGTDVEWDLTNQLLAAVADATKWLQWSKSKDASKGGKPPDPIPRPGVEPTVKRYGSIEDALPEDEMIDWLGPKFAHLKKEAE